MTYRPIAVAIALTGLLTCALPAQALSLGVNLGASGSASTGSASNTDASASASGSLGLDLGLGSQASQTGGVSGNGGTAISTASLGGSATVNSGAPQQVTAAIALINANQWTDQTLSTTDSVTSGTTLDLTPMLTVQTQAQLDSAVSAHEGDIQHLQTALAANAAIAAWLQSKNVSPDNVIAVGQTADGSLAFFTMDQ